MNGAQDFQMPGRNEDVAKEQSSYMDGVKSRKLRIFCGVFVAAQALSVQKRRDRP